jgi:diguanylate cyclase (GGDEF)-like protein
MAMLLNAIFWPQLALHAGLAGAAFLVGLGVGLDGTGATRQWLWLSSLLLLVTGAAALSTGRLARARHWALRAVPAAIATPGAGPPSGRDALTGLLNRPALVGRLDHLLAGRRRDDRALAVLHLDLADFKAINSTLGHAAGDLLLRHAGARLQGSLRDTDMIARLSADEFAIVQTDIDGPGSAARLCERLLQAIAEPFELCGRATWVGASIGVAVHPSDGADAEDLLAHAGLALHRAQQEGGKTFRFFDDGMDAALRARKELEQDLHQALGDGRLELHYQPLVDLARREMVGVEALLRWAHPTRGRVPPDTFIPLAEHSGLIHPIGAWVLDQACAQAVRWQAAGAPDLRIAVNVSPVQFQRGDLAEIVEGTLERSGLRADHLELEITERVLMENSTATLATLERLRGLGVRISIDDFGVGHSSFTYLAQFPFSDIKLDRSFVAGLGRDASATAIVKAALSLGRNLGLQAVAEGVETAEQLAFLDAEGCPLAQGFYFSPPVSAAEIDAIIAWGATSEAQISAEIGSASA